jgi:hypothetical protein
MASQVADDMKREAIIAVFSRLGEDNLAMLKHNLRTDYKIDLENNTFTLEELQVALHRFMGGNGANLLISEIHKEMRLLAGLSAIRSTVS